MNTEFKNTLATLTVAQLVEAPVTIVITDTLTAEIKFKSDYFDSIECSIVGDTDDYVHAEMSFNCGDDLELETPSVYCNIREPRSHFFDYSSLESINEAREFSKKHNLIIDVLRDFLEFAHTHKDELIENYMDKHVKPWRERQEQQRKAFQEKVDALTKERESMRKITDEETDEILNQHVAQAGGVIGAASKPTTHTVFKQHEKLTLAVRLIIEDADGVTKKTWQIKFRPTDEWRNSVYSNVLKYVHHTYYEVK